MDATLQVEFSIIIFGNFFLLQLEGQCVDGGFEILQVGFRLGSYQPLSHFDRGLARLSSTRFEFLTRIKNLNLCITQPYENIVY